VPAKNGIFSQPKDLYRTISGPSKPLLGSLGSTSRAKERLPWTEVAMSLKALIAFSSLGFARRISVMELRAMKSFTS